MKKQRQVQWSTQGLLVRFKGTTPLYSTLCTNIGYVEQMKYGACIMDVSCVVYFYMLMYVLVFLPCVMVCVMVCEMVCDGV